MNPNDRPLSPHLSIYRWPVTMVSSILHRATGIAMAVAIGSFFWRLFPLVRCMDADEQIDPPGYSMEQNTTVAGRLEEAVRPYWEAQTTE